MSGGPPGRPLTRPVGFDSPGAIFPLRSGGRPPGRFSHCVVGDVSPTAILSARTESMEKDAPKGGPFGIPTNLGCLLLWFFSSGQCFPETVKNPTGFFGPLFVRCTSCPISRRLPRSDNGSTADSVRRREQSEPDGGGDAPPRERTIGRGSCPLWVYKGPCPLLALSPISVHTEMGPPEGVVAKSALPWASFGRPRPASLLLLSPANPPALPGPPFPLGSRKSACPGWDRHLAHSK